MCAPLSITKVTKVVFHSTGDNGAYLLVFVHMNFHCFQWCVPIKDVLPTNLQERWEEEGRGGKRYGDCFSSSCAPHQQKWYTPQRSLNQHPNVTVAVVMEYFNSQVYSLRNTKCCKDPSGIPFFSVVSRATWNKSFSPALNRAVRSAVTPPNPRYIKVVIPQLKF